MGQLKHNIGDTVGYVIEGKVSQYKIIGTRENPNGSVLDGGTDYIIQKVSEDKFKCVGEADIV